MTAHISQVPVGTYKKAHRHGPGAHVIVVEGSGYSLMWPEGSDLRRFDWEVGSLVVPPDMWFHQHFNTGPEPAKYLALRWNSRKYRVFKKQEVDKDVADGGSQIETKDEDPRVRQIFEEELAKHGVESRLDPL
jgi:oxalate decarboxylase/phosphoglucose isomerase-like protein (cupin superfamily)